MDPQKIDELLELADRYADDDFLATRKKQNEENAAAWYGAADAANIGIREHWEDPANFSPAVCTGTLTIPCFLEDTPLKGFIGSFWVTRTFTVPEHLAGKAMRLWLGTIVDNDIFYVNGVKVGETPYQYPPRKY